VRPDFGGASDALPAEPMLPPRIRVAPNTSGTLSPIQHFDSICIAPNIQVNAGRYLALPPGVYSVDHCSMRGGRSAKRKADS
jgi:hypothetical protein